MRAIIIAPVETINVPSRVGIIPYRSLLGIQVIPVRNPRLIALAPCWRRKNVIKNTMIAENDAHRNSILLIISPLLNLLTLMIIFWKILDYWDVS